MDEKDVSKENHDSLCPMFFGVSCAFFALKFMPDPEFCDEKWSESRSEMLKGSAHLLGLLVWTVQKKLENVQREIAELKKIRSEDAKANEKVVSIFAGREQSWFSERKKLRQQIGALMSDLRILKAKRDESVSEFGEKMKEIEVILQLKDKVIEETEQKRMEIEEKLKAAEGLIEELKETAKSESQRHSSEISKHKTAFIEVISSHRQLEAEVGRAFKQVEAAKQELDSALEQKEQLGLVKQKLSMELVRMHKDLEQKDQILSAVLRKSRLDAAEKQMLLKEVKSSKAKRKQAEVEMERWKAVLESKRERHSLRNMLLNGGVNKSRKDERRFEHKHSEMRKGLVEPELAADAKNLENWVNSEADKFKIAIEQRHQVDIDAFVEQLRQKNEQLEAYSWRLMSTERESKRMQSHIEALDHEITQLRQESMKLQGMLTDREAELQSLQEQLKLRVSPQKLRVKSSQHDAARADGTDWSRVKVVKRKPGQRRQEMKETAEKFFQVVENDNLDAKEQNQDIILTLESANKEIKDLSKRSNSAWKMDIHALGVSYKVKRLKQQLFMLERLTGKKESSENGENNVGVKGYYSTMSLLTKQVDRYESLQAKIDDLCMRMHENNLNSKCGGTNMVRPEDESKRMEHFLEETFQVQRYIVATGQKLMEVQAKIASSFAGNGEDIEKPASFDMRRFSDGIKTLLQEVQRGIEVRISRIIGDLEGALTCDGFQTSRKLRR